MSVDQPLLLTARVAPHWEQAQRRMNAARVHLRRITRTSMGIYALGALALQVAPFAQSWAPAVRMAALSALFACCAFWFAHLFSVQNGRSAGAPPHPDPAAALQGMVVGGLTGLLAGLAAFTMPRELRPDVMRDLAYLPPGFAIVIPLATAGFFGWTLRNRPEAARLLGLSRLVSLRHTLIGAAAGACVGLHFWVTYTLLAPVRPLQLISPAHVVWLICFSVGLQALGEELFFRGVLFRLYEECWDIGRTNFAPILLLNAFVYLLPGFAIVAADLWLWRIGYGLIFAAVATWLRSRENSLAGPIAANVVFTLLFSLGGAH